MALKITQLLAPQPKKQQGVSLLVSLVMLLILTVIGVSALEISVVELKMSTSFLEQGAALNSAEELLTTAETTITGIVDSDSEAYDFAVSDDGFYAYVQSGEVDTRKVDWSGLASENPDVGKNDLYITEYLGAKPIPGESIVKDAEGRIVGGLVHTFRVTTRSETGRGAVRLVQSIYVTEGAP